MHAWKTMPVHPYSFAYRASVSAMSAEQDTSPVQLIDDYAWYDDGNGQCLSFHI
jgi:hypothetical protein